MTPNADTERILDAWAGIEIEGWLSCQDPRVPDHGGNQCGAGAHVFGPNDLARLALASVRTEPQAALIKENLRLLRVLRQLADQFQQVYESAYAPAPAGENGVYAEARQILREVWGDPQQFDGRVADD